MIDTVKICSPALSESDAQAITQACVLRSAVDVASGELLYSLTTGSLAGSWDSRVSVRVERERWQVDAFDEMRRIEGERLLVRKHDCPPFLTVEGSVHKALLGHNIHGGPLHFAQACRWFVADLSERLGISLPVADTWEVCRADWAEVFDLGKWEACEEFVSGLNMSSFPRRSVIRYGSESLMAPGRTTALKVYHKGPEFHAHDRKRLSAWLCPADLDSIQQRANGILRVETSIKARKLQADFEGKPTVAQVTQAWLEEVHDRETARLLREAESEMEIVRTHREVSARLASAYERRLAHTLFGTWMQLAALGEAEVRKSMAVRTWYRQRKQLVEAGVAWLGADVIIRPRHSAIPAGFTLKRDSPFRLSEVDPTVHEKLLPYAIAA